MSLRRTMQSSIARVNGQLDPRCSVQTYRRPKSSGQLQVRIISQKLATANDLTVMLRVNIGLFYLSVCLCFIRAVDRHAPQQAGLLV